MIWSFQNEEQEQEKKKKKKKKKKSKIFFLENIFLHTKKKYVKYFYLCLDVKLVFSTSERLPQCIKQ